MPSLGLKEILFLVGLVVLFFGAKRIPDIAKGLGTGIRNFKMSLRPGGRRDEEEAPLLKGKAGSPEGTQRSVPEDGDGAV